MIHFQKQGNMHLSKRYDSLIGIVIFAIFIAIIFHQLLLFLAIGLLITYIILAYFFEKLAGNGVYLENKKRSIVLFPEDKINLTLPFQNRSKWGKLHGKFLFSISDNVIVNDIAPENKDSKINNVLPLSLPTKTKVELPLSIQAAKRGVARINNLSYLFLNPFSFETITLKAHDFYQTEIVVYPEKKKVFGLEEIMTNKLGDTNAYFSLHQDQLEPIGTRDYSHTDPMQHIHWKASAKTQQLQTKVYQKKMNMSWTIIINVAAYSRLGNAYVNNNLEDYLSAVAYLCDQAIRKGYQVAIHLNLSKVGNTYFKMDYGSGKLHLKQLLDLLARVSYEYPIISISNMLQQIDQNLFTHHAIIFLGEQDYTTEQYLSKWKNRNVNIFTIHEVEESYWINRA